MFCLCLLLPPLFKTVVKSGKFYIDEGEERSFKLDKSGVLYFEFEIDFGDEEDISNGQDGIEFELYGEDSYGEEIFSEKFKIKIPNKHTGQTYWYWPDEKLPVGQYYMYFDTLTYKEIKCNYTITRYNNFAESFSIPKTLNIKTDENKKLKITNIKPSGALHGASFTVSNTKIAEVDYDGSNTIRIYGLKAGTCNLVAKLENGKKYTCKITVKNPSPKLNYTSLTLHKGNRENLTLKYATKKVIWKSSNTKVATVSKNGEVIAKGIGKCIITAKCNNKTYKTTVNVEYEDPNFTALLYEYNTRDNYFVVKFRNHSKKNLTIYSKDAYCMEVDYKTFDRKLRLPNNKNITIKAGETKSVKFKVKGTTTWWNYNAFTIRYYFSFDGKKYLGSSWNEDCSYKDGKSWWTTYWNEEDLERDYGRL